MGQCYQMAEEGRTIPILFYIGRCNQMWPLNEKSTENIVKRELKPKLGKETGKDHEGLLTYDKNSGTKQKQIYRFKAGPTIGRSCVSYFTSPL